MSSFAKRLILTVTAVPLLFCLIFFLPHYNHLTFAILVLIATVVGSYEMHHLLFKDGAKSEVPPWLAALLPLMQYLELAFLPTLPLVLLTFSAILLYGLAKEIFVGAKDDFSSTMERLSKTVFLFFYPALLLTFIIRILFLSEAKLLLLLLFLLVFGNDTFAYLFGMLFGKKSRNILAVSPNKSVIGFIGGGVMTIVLSLLMSQLVPSLRTLIAPYQALLLGLIVTITGNLGDLIESVFKRSANVKDSGKIILGRGGLLDSIDSLLASTPFFYLFLRLIIQ